jgi:beta-lactamase regulating signal transducer with metallopeptidase domain
MDGILVLKASVLLVAALGAARVLRHASATSRHQVWTLTFAALLGLPLVARVVPQLSVPMPSVWQVAPLAGGSGVATGAVVPAAGRLDLSTILTGAWIAGSLVAVAMVLLSLWRVHRLRLTATRRPDQAWHDAARDIAVQLHLSGPPRLLMSSAVSTPMVGGLWQPVVFLPDAAHTWTHEYRDIVLAHELAHVARRDPLRHIMLRFAVALYWFHPLAWLAARQARAAQEQACDEDVLSLGTRASVYARVLMDMAGPSAPAHLAALPMSERPLLETRIMTILNAAPVSNRRRTLTVAALGIVLLTLSVAAAQPRSAEQAQTPAVTPAQKAAASLPQDDAALRQLDEWRRVEAEFRAHAEWMKAQDSTLREQMRQAEETYRAQTAAFDTLAAKWRAEIDVIRDQEERTRSEVAETMKMLEKLARSGAILTTEQQLRQERELNQELARRLAELEKSIQRQR